MKFKENVQEEPFPKPNGAAYNIYISFSVDAFITKFLLDYCSVAPGNDSFEGKNILYVPPWSRHAVIYLGGNSWRVVSICNFYIQLCIPEGSCKFMSFEMQLIDLLPEFDIWSRVAKMQVDLPVIWEYCEKQPGSLWTESFITSFKQEPGSPPQGESLQRRWGKLRWWHS